MHEPATREDPEGCSFDSFTREERRIPSEDPGIELFLMRVAARGPRRGAVVLMHGAGSASSSIWDLRAGRTSMMRSLACRGFDTYAVDVRGFGGSTVPDGMKGTPEAGPPQVRAAEAARDVHAAVLFAARTSSVARVDLIGWSWGCEVLGLYAGTHPERVRRLVLYAPLYDRKWPTRHQERLAWYEVSRANISRLFDGEREAGENVWNEHIAAMFRFAGGDKLRLPFGPYRDLYGPDAPIWSAAKVTAPTLIVRGERDHASLDVHAQHLFHALAAAPERRYVVIANGDHFLPRERRAPQLRAVIGSFLSEDLDPIP